MRSVDHAPREPLLQIGRRQTVNATVVGFAAFLRLNFIARYCRFNLRLPAQHLLPGDKPMSA